MISRSDEPITNADERAHHPLAPSSFPAWSRCPCFDGTDEDREDAAVGTYAHAILAEWLRTGARAVMGSVDLPQSVKDGVDYAHAYITALAKGEGKELHVERRVEYHEHDGFSPDGRALLYFGTADALILSGSTAFLIDFKSGWSGHDFKPQLAGYALAVFEELSAIEQVHCTVIHGATRSMDCITLSKAEAAGIVLPIIKARRDPKRQPVANEWCGLCAHRATCPALHRAVTAAGHAAGLKDDDLPLVLDPTAITNPAALGRMMNLIRAVTQWAEATRKQITRRAADDGQEVEGYRIQERRGSRDVADLNEAFNRLDLPADQFIGACKLSLPKLADIYADAKGTTNKQAAAEVEDLLDGLITEGAPTKSLVRGGNG